MEKSKRNTTLLFAVVIFVAVICSMQIAKKSSSSNKLESSKPKVLAATILPKPKKLPDFKLTASDGSKFDINRIKGDWTFLFFGYTYCPSICPKTLETMDNIATRIGTPPAAKFAFITIDPKRDSVERLNKFLSEPRFSNANILGATGNPSQMRELAESIGVYISEGDGSDTSKHLNHSGTIMLINPEGKLHAIFTNPDNASNIAWDLKEIIRSYS
jgi:protein SCO1